MANTVFDKETLLDLLVNGIPLFIMLFFIGVFVAIPVFGFAGIEAGLQFGIVGLSFIALTVLSYIVGKAITLAEENETVYMPGQATVEGSKPLKEREEALEGDEEESEETAGELTEDETGEDVDAEASDEDTDADDDAAQADDEPSADADADEDEETASS